MKVKLGILFLGALVLVAGCARKCPPCPSCANAPVYGSSSYSALPSSPSVGSTSSTGSTSGYGSGSGYQYVKK